MVCCSLYDVRKDEFHDGSLFNNALPDGAIRLTSKPKTIFDYDFTNSYSSKFKKLNIEADLKLSILTGLVDVSLSGKYLSSTDENSRTIKLTIIYCLKTKREQLNLSHNLLENCLSINTFNNQNITHIVTGITWGANVYATCEKTVKHLEEKREIEGKLRVKLEKMGPLVSAGVGGSINNDKRSEVNQESFRISFSGDVLIKQIPSTIEDVMEMVKTIPSIVETINEGKGIQLEYSLYPLKEIVFQLKQDVQIHFVLYRLNEYIVTEIENEFDAILEAQRKFNDIVNDIEALQIHIPREAYDIVMNKKRDIDTELGLLRQDLAIAIERVRRGLNTDKQQLNSVETILQQFKHNSSCSVQEIRKFIDDNNMLKKKISLLKTFQEKGVELIDKD
ncbi:unnamed protein product [Didymodactylos carnosus]|uniref:SNTX MACPF/CDC-like domain-containing protein n=1 Tax=Didymodactylos carnosus TaxID=1234261 RepID=A0A8S2EC80_9BILA|nr:unnamed protein product [Didymodactylos carnosus]CAF3980419.1 unnamed protein product [Didymodactylos carnosus]